MLLTFFGLLLLAAALAAASAWVAAQCGDELAGARRAGSPLIAASLLISLALLLFGAAQLWLQLCLVAFLFLGLLRFAPALLFRFLLAPLLFIAALAPSPAALAAVACLLLGAIAFGYLSMPQKRAKGERWFSPALVALRSLAIPVLATGVIVVVISFVVVYF